VEEIMSTVSSAVSKTLLTVLKAPVEVAGRTFLSISLVLGGMLILILRMIKSVIPPDIDRREFFRNLHWMGNKSVAIVAFSSFFVGVTMVVQATIYVESIGAYSLVGWGSGYIVLRELGPIFVALMFSGRVGSNNTAELATMTVTEQIDALRALSIDPYSYLVFPRVVSMVIINFVLTAIGDTVALIGAASFSSIAMNLDLHVFWRGIHDYLSTWDMWLGIIKSFIFGFIIAVSSCYWGLNVKGGAPGVGKAVYSSVVSSAAGIFVSNYIITFAIG